MTKKQRTMYDTYSNADATSIYHVYDNPSMYKVEIAEACLRLCAAMDGERPRFFSANTFTFSFAFMYDCKNDGHKHLFYRTKSRDYDFPIH